MAQWSRLKKFLVIGAGVIGGLFVLLIILAVVLPDPEPTAVPTTSTLIPTVVLPDPEPTQSEPTAIPPTSTLIPTATLPPAPECPSAGEQIYFSTMADIMDSLGEGMTELASLSFEASDNWLVTQDSSWVLEVAVVLSSFQATADEISAISTSQSVQSIHSDLLQVASSLRAIVPLYSTGIDNIDADLIVAATEQMEEIGRLVSVMVGKAESFCE